MAQCLRTGQTAWRGPGGQYQGVPRQHRAVVDLHVTRADIQSHGAVTQHLVHLQFTGPPAVGQYRLLGRPAPVQHLLGEGRPVIGQVQLLTDQRDAPVESLGAQRLDGSPTGQ